MEENIGRLRRDLALAIADGKILETLRQLKMMPLETLELLSADEAKGVDMSESSDDKIQGLENGLKKLDFYVCGILMHRILEK